MTKRSIHPERGFSLVELLVVIAIIALLTSILMPSLSAAKHLARTALDLSNLRNCGSAMGVYTTDNRQYFWAVRAG